MIIGLIGLLSCEKVDKTTVKTNPGAPVLNLSDGASYTLELANKDVPIIYTWSPADFGAQLVVTYNVQIAKAGTDFAEPISLGTVINNDTLSILTVDLNNKLLAMLADPEIPEPLALDFRVIATVNTNVNTAISGSVGQTITPYYVKIVYPLLFVPGSYQGWNPADSSTSIASLKSNDMYEGYIWFETDNVEFKYTQGPSWDVNWGDDGADGTLNPGGANIVAGTAGYYKLNVDLVGLTHTFLRTDWAVIGSATPGGWDADTPMTYDPAAKVWTVTLNLTAGEIKFRANGSWDLNYGDDDGNGSLELGGGNIAVPAAGNYKVTLDFSKPIYKYKLEID